jgi:hypothetical protein
MNRKLSNGNPAGYGTADRQLAESLSRAASKGDADKIARDNGLKDAADAARWLSERS